jgi:arylsulfatase A-like enzyme
VQGFERCLIDKGRPTVASFLKSRGYHTAIIGKWHLNFRYIDPKTGKDYRKAGRGVGPVGAMIPDGPVHRGFDYFHGIHHAGSMKAIIENDRVVEHDDVENFLPRLTKKSVEYINSRAGKRQPFFLYVPLGSPHNPIVPTPEWQGRSGLGKYGDFVMQTDHVVGEVSKALAANGFSDNTLLIFTSDNGCSKSAKIPALAKQGHRVSAHFRGSKADIWDGGHRVPFIARWPGKIKPGTSSDQLICLTDLFASVIEIVGAEVPPGTCEDSVSFLPALSGQPITSTRKGVIHHSFSGHFAYRTGNWKLLLARGSGGWTSPKESEVGKDAPKAQLYDMAADPSEKNNLYLQKPDVASQLLEQLTAYVRAGRSTDGAASKNDIDDIVLWKSASLKSKKNKKRRRDKQAPKNP